MPEITVKGVPVNFPFEPYDIQVAYMEKVIECLEMESNGVLESPTGTGKTLSLLCASCGWLMQKKAQLQAHLQPQMFELMDGDFVTGLRKSLNTPNEMPSLNEKSIFFQTPRIIYATRTHSQLSQVIQELKRTSYNHFKVSVIGSRDQMCINSDVAQETGNALKVLMCRNKVNSRTCHFYNNVERKKEEIAQQPGILDIEDLVKLGLKLQCCPYYTARDLSTTADIVFLPYNYLLDPKTRKLLNLELKDSIIILDEAHNIEKVCEECASMDFTSTDIALCIEEITEAMLAFSDKLESCSEFLEDAPVKEKGFSADDLCLLKTIFLELEKAVDNIQDGSTFPGDYMFEFLSKIQVTPGKLGVVVDVLNNIVLYLSTASQSPFHRRGTALQKFSDLLTLVFRNVSDTPEYLKQLRQNYRVHIRFDDSNKKKKSDSWSVIKSASQGRVLSYWCFSPQFSMDLLLSQGTRSVVLTSGTLAPLKPFISELGIPISVQLENPHIIGPDQVCVAVVKNGPDGCLLSSSFKTRDDPRYISSLARTILNLSRIIPDGLLIFFPSYYFLNMCQEKWKNEGMWAKISAIKPIFVEPRSKTEFATTMEAYYNQIHDPETKGACFMAVTRGKVSEGLDFADFNGRAVIITGLPYPPFKDPRVVLKQKYLENIVSTDNKALSGTEWYQLEATRAVNQAIGRVIRHAKDYGTILLCDSRFDSIYIKKQLSSWLQPHIKTYSDFGSLTRNVKEFFRSAEKNFPAPKAKPGTQNIKCAPAVPAYFDTSNIGYRPSQPNTLSANEDLSSKWCPQDYSVAMVQNPTTNDAVKTSEALFEALDTSSSVIDFNDTSSFAEYKSIQMNKKDDVTKEPLPKRLKIKIAPLIFNDTAFESAIEEQLEIPVHKSKISCCSQPQVSEPGPSSSNTHKKNEDKKYSEISHYLIQLKSSLSSGAYSKFVEATSHYNKTSDYEHLIEILTEIFQYKKALLLDFHRFIRKEHRERFKLLCKSLKD